MLVSLVLAAAALALAPKTTSAQHQLVIPDFNLFLSPSTDPWSSHATLSPHPSCSHSRPMLESMERRRKDDDDEGDDEGYHDGKGRGGGDGYGRGGKQESWKGPGSSKGGGRGNDEGSGSGHRGGGGSSSGNHGGESSSYGSQSHRGGSSGSKFDDDDDELPSRGSAGSGRNGKSSGSGTGYHDEDEPDQEDDDDAPPPKKTVSTQGLVLTDCDRLSAFYVSAGGTSWVTSRGWLPPKGSVPGAETVARRSRGGKYDDEEDDEDDGDRRGGSHDYGDGGRSGSGRSNGGSSKSGAGGSSKAVVKKPTPPPKPKPKITPACCSWFGVHCNPGGRVTAVNLGSNGLKGRVADDFWEMGKLRNLNLSANALAGRLPLSFPTNLTSLLLADNHFVFSPLGPVTFPPALATVSLARNSLVGEISFALSPRLQNVDLTGNALTALELPPGGGKALKRLKAGGNQLATFLGQQDMSAAEGLLFWNMSSNGLTGQLPSFTSHPLLTTLDLSNNHLTGPIPPSLLPNHPALVHLDLASNSLTSKLPALPSASANALSLPGSTPPPSTPASPLHTCNLAQAGAITCPVPPQGLTTTASGVSTGISWAKRCHVPCDTGSSGSPSQGKAAVNGTAKGNGGYVPAGLPGGGMVPSEGGMQGYVAASGAEMRIFSGMEGLVGLGLVWVVMWRGVMRR